MNSGSFFTDLSLTDGATTVKLSLSRDKAGNAGLSIRQAPGLGEAARPGLASYQDYPPAQEYVVDFTDFSMGAGQFEAADTLTRRYHYSKGIDARWGILLPWPQLQVSGLQPEPTVLGLNGLHKAYLTWQGSDYSCDGRAVYHWESVSGVWQWVLWDDSHVALNISHAIIFDNALLVQWETEAHFHIFTDPSDNSVVAANAVFGAPVYRFAVCEDALYCNVIAADLVYSNTLSAEATLANWTLIRVGDLSYDFNDMFLAKDFIFCGKDDAGYVIDRNSLADGKARLAVPMRESPSDGNFRYHAILGDWLICAVGHNDKNLVGYNLISGEVRRTGFHPKERAPNTPQLSGRIRGMCNSEDQTKVYLAIEAKGPAVSGITVFLVETSEREGQLIDHTVGGFSSDPTHIVLSHMTGIGTTVLWWFDAHSPYQPRYYRWPIDGVRPDYDTTYFFDIQTDNYLFTPWITGSFVDLQKAYYNLRSELQNLLANARTAAVAYQLEGGTDVWNQGWTTLASYSAAGWSELANFPHNTASRRIRFRLHLYTNNRTLPPRFEKLVAKGRVMADNLDLLQVSATARDGEIAGAREARDNFRTLCQSNAALKLVIGSGGPQSSRTWVGSIVRDSVNETMAVDQHGQYVYSVSFAFLEANAASP